MTISVQVWGCGGGVGSVRSFGCFWGYGVSAVERVEKEEVFCASLGVCSGGGIGRLGCFGFFLWLMG